MKNFRNIVSMLAVIAFTSFAHKAEAQQLKVMEYNILSFEGVNNSLQFRVEPVVEFIKKHNPDIICFNEFENWTSRMGAYDVLTKVGMLLGMYPYYGVSYVKGDGLYGNGILTKYPIINAFSKELVKPGGSSDQRSYEYVDILVPTAEAPKGNIVRVICTHLDHVSGQFQQAQQITKEAIVPSPYPTLILGDMNVGQESSTIREYLKYGDRLCNDDGTFGRYTKLDYILGFPKGKWEVISYMVDRQDPTDTFSDHFPIIGVVKVKK